MEWGKGDKVVGREENPQPSERALQVMGHCQDESWGPPAQETGRDGPAPVPKWRNLLVKPPAPSARISGSSLDCVPCPLLLRITAPVTLPSQGEQVSLLRPAGPAVFPHWRHLASPLRAAAAIHHLTLGAVSF